MGEAVVELKRHPLSAAWGDMPADELQALVDDIRAHGQREPIVLFDGMVLDGWHRYRACAQLGVAAANTEFPGDEDPVGWVISRNGHRRSQSAGQKAMAIAECVQWRTRGRPAVHSRGESAPGAELGAKSLSAGRKSADDMARAVGVSARTVEQAKEVIAKAAPEVRQAVKAGKVSVKRAAEVAKLPMKEQAKALAEKKPEPKPKAAPADDSVSDLLDDMRADLERAESTAREFEAAMKADDQKKMNAALVRRLEQAERRRDEAMEDAKRIQAARDFYERQLARCGKAVGERDLDKVAARVEAFVREHGKKAA